MIVQDPGHMIVVQGHVIVIQGHVIVVQGHMIVVQSPGHMIDIQSHADTDHDLDLVTDIIDDLAGGQNHMTDQGHVIGDDQGQKGRGPVTDQGRVIGDDQGHVIGKGQLIVTRGGQDLVTVGQDQETDTHLVGAGEDLIHDRDLAVEDNQLS